MLIQKDIAEHLDLSQQAVSSLCADLGIDWKAVTLDEIRVAYIRRLREQAAGRAAVGDLDLAGERARLAKEQADKIAMQNAERRGELAPVAAMEMVLANVGTKVGRILDTIPAMVRRRVPDVDSKTIEAIEADIAKCRNQAAAMTLASLDEPDEADQEEPEVLDA